MRIVRHTMFPPNDTPMTVVLRETDARDWGEATVAKPMAGAFVIVEEFTMPGAPTIEEATLEAGRRMKLRELRDANMALLYHWDGTTLGRVNAGGVLAATQPAPLDTADIEMVLVQLVEHPNYQGQTIIAVAKNGEIITLRNGTIQREGA